MFGVNAFGWPYPGQGPMDVGKRLTTSDPGLRTYASLPGAYATYAAIPATTRDYARLPFNPPYLTATEFASVTGMQAILTDSNGPTTETAVIKFGVSAADTG